MSDPTVYASDVDAALADVALIVEAYADTPALTDGDRLALAERLALLDRVNAALNAAAGHVTDALADLMESNDERVGRWAVTRKTKWSRTRDQAAAREDARRVIVNDLALDRESGALNPTVARVADEAIGRVYDAFSVNLTYGGMKHLGLDVDEYEVKSRAGWSIALHNLGGDA